jgi:hypothetical protein
MAVVAHPDLIGALNSRIRSFSEVTDLVATAAGATDSRTTPRVSSVLQDWWKLPTHAVRLKRVGGPPGKIQIGKKTSRVDVLCFGSTEYEAGRLLGIVSAAIAPDQSRQVSFIQTVNGVRCRVYSIDPEGDVIVDTDPDTGWPFAWQPMLVTWSAVPA